VKARLWKIETELIEAELEGSIFAIELGRPVLCSRLPTFLSRSS
jgi:hypothetical protein